MQTANQGIAKSSKKHAHMVEIARQMLRDARRERIRIAREIAEDRTAVLKQIYGEKTTQKCVWIDVFAEWESKKAKTMKEIRAKAIEIARSRFGAANEAADEVFGPVATEEPAEWEEQVDAAECEA
jgi:hypothetical protein